MAKRWTLEQFEKMARQAVDVAKRLPPAPGPGAAHRETHKLWVSTLEELANERERTNKARRKA